MGKVVDLGAGKRRRTAARAGRRRPRQSKTALVLGGGGFTGGVYEVGALRALDLLSVRHFAAEKERTRAWRKILEQTTGALLRQSGSA